MKNKIKNKIKNLVEIVNKENLLKRLSIGVAGGGFMTSLALYNVENNSTRGYKTLTRELTPSGDITYMIDSSENILAYHVPRARMGMGGVSKYYVAKNSERYKKLIKMYKEDK